ncbi:hypothetical protein GVAV_000888 [Gurleya vavrai]
MKFAFKIFLFYLQIRSGWHDDGLNLSGQNTGQIYPILTGCDASYPNSDYDNLDWVNYTENFVSSFVPINYDSACCLKPDNSHDAAKLASEDGYNSLNIKNIDKSTIQTEFDDLILKDFIKEQEDTDFDSNASVDEIPNEVSEMLFKYFKSIPAMELDSEEILTSNGTIIGKDINFCENSREKVSNVQHSSYSKSYEETQVEQRELIRMNLDNIKNSFDLKTSKISNNLKSAKSIQNSKTKESEINKDKGIKLRKKRKSNTPQELKGPKICKKGNSRINIIEIELNNPSNNSFSFQENFEVLNRNSDDGTLVKKINKKPKSNNSKKASNSFILFFKNLEKNALFERAKNDTIIIALNFQNTFDHNNFTVILREKIEKIEFFIQEHNKDCSADNTYKFYNYDLLKKDINKFLNDNKNFKFYHMKKKFERNKFIDFLQKGIVVSQEKNVFYDSILFFIEKINDKYKEKRISSNDLRKIIKTFDKINTKFTVEIYSYLKNKVFEIINTKNSILEKFFPDIFDCINLEEIFVFNNEIILTNRDLYEYLIFLFVFKKLINLDNEIIIISLNNNKPTISDEDDKYNYSECKFFIRYHFMRIIFPLVKRKIFLNYIELYYLFIYEDVEAGYKFLNKKSLLPNTNKNLVLSTIYFFRLQKNLSLLAQKKDIPNFALLCFCICLKETSISNDKKYFFRIFVAIKLYDITKILIEKNGLLNDINSLNWKTVIKKNEKERNLGVETVRKNYEVGMTLIANSFVSSIL